MTSNNNPCRNCGGTEFYSNEVHARGGYGPNLLPIGFFSSAKFRLQVCGNCGLTDWFVPAEYLKKVKERFQPEI